MSLVVNKGTTVTLSGRVSGGGDITGWRLWLVGLEDGAALLKTTDSADEVLITDGVAGDFEVYLTAEDTAEAAAFPVQVRGSSGGREYLLARETLIINA